MNSEWRRVPTRTRKRQDAWFSGQRHGLLSAHRLANTAWKQERCRLKSVQGVVNWELPGRRGCGKGDSTAICHRCACWSETAPDDRQVASTLLPRVLC